MEINVIKYRKFFTIFKKFFEVCNGTELLDLLFSIMVYEY